MGEVKLRIRNSLSTDRTVVLEPWADEFLLPAGRTFLVVAEGDLAYPMEVEVADDRIVVYALDSAGAMLSMYDEAGEKLF